MSHGWRSTPVAVTGLLALVVMAASPRWNGNGGLSLADQAGNVLPADARPVVLFDGWRDGQCAEDLVLSQEELAALGDVNVDATPDCPSLLIMLARGWGVAVRRDAWNGTPGDDGRPITVRMPAEVQLPLGVWVTTDQGLSAGDNDPPAMQFARRSVERANAIFRQNRVGIRLTPSYTLVRRAEARAATIGSGCGSVYRLRAASTASGVYSPHQLNVYVVSSIKLPQSADGPAAADVESYDAGRSCIAFDGPEVIFVAYSGWEGADDDEPDNQAAALAHEIGHSLGLWEPKGGHTEDVGGMPDDNFMVNGFPAVGGHVSIGQIVRMHFDSRSWLTRRAVGVDPPYSVTCQASVSESWPCPRLALDAPARAQ